MITIHGDNTMRHRIAQPFTIFDTIADRLRRILVNAGPAMLLMACLGLTPVSASAYVLKDDARGTYLSVFGIGSVRLNYTSVDGNIALFEESRDGLLDDVDTQELLSLTVNGLLFNDYSLEGEVHYDPADVPDWNFYAKLSRDGHYALVGDQTQIFDDVYFSRYTQPFRGLTLHAEGDRYAVTTFGAVTRGETEREELTPDGTSGTYDFSNIPVVPDSDIVTLEVRNQFDPSEVLEVIPQERNVDYTIDYDTGELTFATPVPSETFRGNPLVIVVIYKGQAESTRFGTALLGSRAVARPVDWLSVGVTHVAEFDRDGNLGDAFDARQEVYSFDSALQLGDSWTLAAEYALSQQHANEAAPDEQPGAFRAELRGAVGDAVDLQATYHRAERDFLTFANPAIETNEQELEMAGVYAYRPNHSLKIGYSFLQDNLPKDGDSATTSTHRPYLEWNAVIREHTELFSKYEYIVSADDQSPSATDKRTQTLLVGGVQNIPDLAALGKVTLRGEYQFSDFEDRTDQAADTLTHQLGLRAASEPVSEVLAYVEQRERLVYDQDAAEYATRQDISEAGLDLNRWERFSAASKYQYRVIRDLRADRKTSEGHVLTLRSEYQIFTPLTSAGKIEWRDDTFFADSAERTSTGLNAEGRLTYTPLKDLTARLRYTYDENREKADDTTTTREDETEFRLNYAFNARKTRLTGVAKLERDVTEAPPTPETETRTTTYIAGVAHEFWKHWDVLAQYKHVRTELSTDTRSHEVFGELGYKFGRFLKFTAGYQHVEFTDGNNASNDYTADSVYLKLIGKL